MQQAKIESSINENHSAGALAAMKEKLLACVHCGLCLEACPTYVHTGDENDSPRGRIYLMRAVEEQRLAATSKAFVRHINRCLGCRACEAACPAGVEYGQLLEAARDTERTANQPEDFAAKVLAFALKHIWSHPKRLKIFFTFSRVMRDAGVAGVMRTTKITNLLPSRISFALTLLEASSSRSSPSYNRKLKTKRAWMFSQNAATQPQDLPTRKDNRLTENHKLKSESLNRESVLLFTGCVTENLFARVNRATQRVLSVNDCRVSVPHAQVCCGALHAHAGDLDGARELARRNIEAFADADSAIITNAGGCGAMLMSYEHLFEDDEFMRERAREFSRRVRDVSQQLAAIGNTVGAVDNDKSARETVVTYDASCHLLYGQKATEEPMAMLRAADVRFVPLEGSETCCGGAGVYNLMQPELSNRILSDKLAAIARTKADVVTTGNPGCHLQIKAGAMLAGMQLEVRHPVELLDEAYRAVGLYDAE